MGAVLLYSGAGAFVLGVFVRSFLSVGLPAIAFVLLVAFAGATIWRRSSTGSGTGSSPDLSSLHAILLASVVLFLGALGMLRMEIASWSERVPALEARVGEEVAFEGVIVRDPERRESSTHLYIETDAARVLAIADRHSAYRYGDRVRVTGELAKPEAFATDLGRTFNYPGYLQARGVSYLIRYGDVEVVASDEGNPLIAELLSMKHRFMRSLESLLPEPHAGLAEGILLGVKQSLGEELEAVFRRTGIIHIVVLSGYNIMLVVSFVMYIFAFFFGLRVRAVVGGAAILSFALLVGLSATVIRASVMATLALFAQATGHAYDTMRALIFAAMCMVVINPYLLAFDPGFQLSVLATAGLILLAPYFEAKLTLVPSFIGIRGLLSATLAAQIFVLPLLLYQIGEFSAVAVLVNVLVLPMVPVAMLLTFVAGLLGMIVPAIAAPFAYLSYASLAFILSAANWFAALPFASYAIPPFSFVFVPLAYGCMAYVLTRLLRERGDEGLRGWTIVEENELLGVRS